METEWETRKDPAARDSVSDVVCEGHRATERLSRMPDGRRREGERDIKRDFHARSVAIMGMKPEIVALHHEIIKHSVPDQTVPSLHHRYIMRNVRLRFESCLELIQKKKLSF